MAQQFINTGPSNPTSGKDGGDIINDNFADLYVTKAEVQYTSIIRDTLALSDSDLILGTNIFGINFGGDVLITLPSGINPNKLVVIKDESGLAGTNNITVRVI